MISLKVIIEDRLNKKFSKAESAYIKINTTKLTQNCKHHGRLLSDNTYVCKLKCMGTDELGAAQCWNEKARGCPEFTLRKTVESLREEFRNIPKEELALRWPSLGELIWVMKTIGILEQKELNTSKDLVNI